MTFDVKLDPFPLILVAGIGALIWMWPKEGSTITPVGGGNVAGSPCTGVSGLPGILCNLGRWTTGGFLDNAGTTDTVPTNTPYQAAWTEDPTTYWMKAKKAGLSLVEACKARAPTQMQYDLCLEAGW